MRIWLVEYDKERFIEHRSRKSEALLLAGGKRDALRPDGFLMLGAAETTVFNNDFFAPLPVEFSNLFCLKNNPAPYGLTPS